jgi:hypothetical protein
MSQLSNISHRLCQCRLVVAVTAHAARSDEGRMKGLAFVLDPDGYWIEIVKRADDAGFAEEFNLSQVHSTHCNHFAIRCCCMLYAVITPCSHGCGVGA